MAQAQLDAQAKANNVFYVDLDGQLTVKVWKKKREGTFVTLMKPAKTQNLTLPLEVFRSLLESQDVLLLAADFIQRLVGFSPADLVEDSMHEI